MSVCVCVCVCLCCVCLCVFIEKIDSFSIVKNYHLNVSLGATKRGIFFSRIYGCYKFVDSPLVLTFLQA